jgi:hypothetical protein
MKIQVGNLSPPTFKKKVRRCSQGMKLFLTNANLFFFADLVQGNGLIKTLDTATTV